METIIDKIASIRNKHLADPEMENVRCVVVLTQRQADQFQKELCRTSADYNVVRALCSGLLGDCFVMGCKIKIITPTEKEYKL